MYPELSEAERFPLLTSAGRKLLHSMRQHPQAPAWNWPNGEQLNAEGLAEVEKFARELDAPRTAAPGPPLWLSPFVDFCLTDVPFYRRRTPSGTRFESIPSTNRGDLSSRVWEFVPVSTSVDELIVFSSSGSTGHPAQLPFHPATAASGIPLLEQALRTTGIQFPRGAEQIALSNIVAYRGAYTTAIVVAFLQEAGCIRVNLHPEVWRQPGDCRAYLDRWWAPVMLGDPQAFQSLKHIRIERPPQAMISCIIHLTDALAGDLSARYGCPVLDLYALTEAGIVALRTSHGHVVLPHDLFVEILDEHDQPVPAGQRGEIVLTGGRNPFLPLLRYRTGDFASLAWRDSRAMLVELEGRQPVVFPVAGDRVVHSMEVTRLLRKFPLSQYQLHQDESGGFRFGYRGLIPADELRGALHELLHKPSSLVVEELPPLEASPRKTQVYHSARTVSPILYC